MTTAGHCLCRNIRYEFKGAPLWIAHCHCESCRRQTSSGMATFVGVARKDLRYLSAEPTRFESSPGTFRTFCPKCGSPITYESEAKWPGEVHFHAGTLADPASITPQSHVHTGEQLPWFEVLDGLPRYKQSSTGAKPVAKDPPRHG